MTPEPKSAIAVAIDKAGGPSKVARAFNCTAQAVCFYRDGKRKMPPELMATLERLSEYEVLRWDMRPDDWFAIWPELIDSEGAPPVPATAA